MFYDARLGAGFPVAPAPRQPCVAGDSRQGPLTNPAPLLVPGSVSQAPGENLPPPAIPTTAEAKPKPVRCRKGYVRHKAKCVRKPKAKKAANRRVGCPERLAA